MTDHDPALPATSPAFRDTSPPSVVVHSTVRGVLIMLLCPLVVAAVGILAQIGGPGRTWPQVVAVAGFGLFAFGLFSFPHRTSFGVHGLTRHCLLRRHDLAWGDIRALERVAQPMGRTRAARRTISTANQARRAGVPARGGMTEAPQVRGGLMARGHGRRRYLLSDVTEGAGQYDAIAELVEAAPQGPAMKARRPAPDTPPTGQYLPRFLR